MVVTAMNKNHPIFTCDMENGKIRRVIEVIDDVHLPIMLQGKKNNSPCIKDLKLVNEWISTRKLSEKRIGLKEIRKEFPSLENYKHMFSLSDQYWFMYKKSDSWDKMNYFTNDFSGDVGNAFFEPWKAADVKTFGESPDLTTNGVLNKRWVCYNGKRYLIKMGDIRAQQEPISEVLASMTLEQLGIIPFVKYSLVVDGLSICCMSENFIDKDTEYVPAIQVFNKEHWDEKKESLHMHMIRMAERYGIEEAHEFIDRMICADYFMCNGDRHLGNFGFIRDVESGELKGFAPLFDCGSAFLGSTGDCDVFKNEKERCVNKYLPDLRKKETHRSGLVALVKKYPKINENQENKIIENVNRVFGKLRAEEKKQPDKSR